MYTILITRISGVFGIFLVCEVMASLQAAGHASSLPERVTVCHLLTVFGSREFVLVLTDSAAALADTGRDKLRAVWRHTQVHPATLLDHSFLANRFWAAYDKARGPTSLGTCRHQRARGLEAQVGQTSASTVADSGGHSLSRGSKEARKGVPHVDPAA